MKPIALLMTGLFLLSTACVQGESGNVGFVWADLITDQPEVSRRFYSELFGWSFAARDGVEDEQIITHRGNEIGAMIVVPTDLPDVPEAQWISVLAVDDAATAAAAGSAVGGEVVTGPASAGEIGGQYAVLRDNEGALITLYSGPTPRLDTPAADQWAWFDLFTTNQASAEKFLNAVAQFAAADAPGHDVTGYRLVGRGDTAQAGIVPITSESLEPAWVPYVAVEDVNDTITRAEALGAKLFARSDTAAILLDPTRAAFGVVALDTEVGL